VDVVVMASGVLRIGMRLLARTIAGAARSEASPAMGVIEEGPSCAWPLAAVGVPLDGSCYTGIPCPRGATAMATTMTQCSRLSAPNIVGLFEKAIHCDYKAIHCDYVLHLPCQPRRIFADEFARLGAAMVGEGQLTIDDSSRPFANMAIDVVLCCPVEDPLALEAIVVGDSMLEKPC
jgi:hypothetical protein